MEGHGAANRLLERVIRTSFRDYIYIKNVTSMCDLVSKRLGRRGIQISVDNCVNSEIESQFGKTLAELYSNFELVVPGLLTLSKGRLARQETQCYRQCDWDFDILFRKTVHQWMLREVPIIQFEQCYYGNLIGTITKNGQKVKKICYALKSFDPNTTNWNFPLGDIEQCFDCLDQIVLRFGEVVTISQNYALSAGALIIDISKVWQEQMAEILSKNASVIRLTV